LFLVGTSFSFILGLITLSGIAVGIFKTAALALIGDISTSTKQHTGTMNGAEAFFGIGAIIGPLLVAWLVREGVDWKWLYVIAGGLCTLLIVVAYKVNYPEFKKPQVDGLEANKANNIVSSLKLLKNPYAMFFSVGAFLYVAAESAIYVWMPSYLVCDATNVSDAFACYTSGSQQMLAMYAVAVFFSLRAAGRFVAG